jgi:hypothetical protein
MIPEKIAERHGKIFIVRAKLLLLALNALTDTGRG